MKPCASLLLALALAFSLQAQFSFTTNNGTLTVTGYSGSSGDVTIPSTINSLPIVCIGAAAFWGATSVTNLIIPEGVTNIGVNAFARSGLTSLTIPNSVISLGSSALSDCLSLTHVTIGHGLTSIPDLTFISCSNLLSVTIPDHITTIGSAAFMHCTSLTNASIGNGVVSTAWGAFHGCAKLTQVALGSRLSSIGPDSFGWSGLTSVTIRAKEIGNYAFRHCESLTNVNFAEAIITVGKGTFIECPELRSMYFRGNAPTDDDSSAFAGDDAIVYHLSGTTGWGATFGGCPTAIWQPEMRLCGATYGAATNQFGFNINWASGRTVVVEACTNLSNAVWVPLQTNTLSTDSLFFSDPQWTNYPRSFYRIRWR